MNIKLSKKLILASGSARRKDLLAKLGLKFEIIESKFKEVKNLHFDLEMLKYNSLGKAMEVVRRINDDATVLGADTIVILDSVCLNKPSDNSEAFIMLKRLSGKTHRVLTAISIVDVKTKKSLVEIVETKVTFRNLKDVEILNYINDKNPLDKAGSYGIQDFISFDQAKNPPPESFIEKIEGDYYNVVGLSIETVANMLNNFAI